MDQHMSGNDTRKRRTVIGDELLKFLKVELLLTTGGTHFLFSNLFLPTSQTVRRGVNMENPQRGGLMDTEVSVLPSASLLTSTTCMCCYWYSQEVNENVRLT